MGVTQTSCTNIIEAYVGGGILWPNVAGEDPLGLTCEFELCGFEKYEGYFYAPHIFPQNAIDASMWDAPIFDVAKSDACFSDISIK